MTAPLPPSFVWRREVAWMALPVALCLAFRLAAAPLAIATFNGDAAVHLLTAKHLTQGEVAFKFYGQAYVGTLEAWLAAPFYLVLGADPAGMGYAQALLAMAVVVAVYRLAWGLGGRIAALGASATFAIGTKLALANTAGQYASYPSTQLLGMLTWICALPLFERPSPVRIAVVGALAGFGAWNNPQISSFLAPLLALALLHGRGLAAWRAGTLGATLGRWRRPLLWGGVVCSLAIALATVNAVVNPWLDYRVTTHAGATITGKKIRENDGRLHLWVDGAERVMEHSQIAKVEPAGELALGPVRISLTRPYRYMVRAILGFGAILALVELAAAPARARALAAVAIAVGGLIVGATPELLFALTRVRQFEGREVEIKPAPVGLDPGMAPTHAETFAKDLGYAMFNAATPEALLPVPSPWSERAAEAYGVAHTGAIALGAIAMALAAWRGRRAVMDVLRLRPPTARLPVLLALHAAGLLVLYLSFPFATNEARYLSPMWIPLSALYGTLVLALWTVRPVLGGAVLAALVAAFALPQAHNLARLAQDCTTRVAYDRRIGDDASKRGVTAGYANFWVGYPATYRADERVAFATWGPPEQLFHYLPYHVRVRQADRKLWVFEPVNNHVDRWALNRLLAGETGDRVVERWILGNPRGRPGGYGPYLMVLTERKSRPDRP